MTLDHAFTMRVETGIVISFGSLFDKVSMQEHNWKTGTKCYHPLTSAQRQTFMTGFLDIILKI